MMTTVEKMALLDKYIGKFDGALDRLSKGEESGAPIKKSCETEDTENSEKNA